MKENMVNKEYKKLFFDVYHGNNNNKAQISEFMNATDDP